MSDDTVRINPSTQDDVQGVKAEYGLDNYGFRDLGHVYWNLSASQLTDQVSARSEGKVTKAGQVLVTTGHHTGLASNDKYIVRESATEDCIWWGEYHRPFDLRKYSAIYRRVLGFAVGRDLFVQDCYTGDDAEHRIPVRIISEHAWQSLVARNLFPTPSSASEHQAFVPVFTVILVPSFRTLPEVDYTDSDTFILLNLDQGIGIIGGTAHSGEIKKAVFAAQNFRLTRTGALTLHSSVNITSDGRTAILAGSCGSGKSSVAMGSSAKLFGDDAHVWHDGGLSNLEAGCYARVAGLSSDSEPELSLAVEQPGVVLENVACKQSSDKPDFRVPPGSVDARAAYPLPQADDPNRNHVCAHPSDFFILTRDATGILPAIARLTPDQAAYHYLSGYTCQGPDTPDSSLKQVFDPCFDAHSAMYDPCRQALLLRDKLVRYGVRCWLINTGWVGGNYGTRKRISTAQTRELITVARAGQLDKVDFQRDPVFGFEVPTGANGIPEHTWSNLEQYDHERGQLARLFIDNFKKLEASCPAEIAQGGPIRDKDK